jgi:hypothetical protein
MEGHWRRVNTPLRRLTQRERIVAIVTAAVTAVALIVLVVVTAGDSRPGPAPGCIRSVIPGVMGASELNACGTRAKNVCAAHATHADPGSQAIQASCRKAGLL